jgi:hypothetical protein
MSSSDDEDYEDEFLLYIDFDGMVKVGTTVTVTGLDGESPTVSFDGYEFIGAHRTAVGSSVFYARKGSGSDGGGGQCVGVSTRLLSLALSQLPENVPVPTPASKREADDVATGPSPPKRRGRPPKARVGPAVATREVNDVAAEPSLPKKRGRPPKAKSSIAAADAGADANTEAPPQPKKRGRPPKAA